MLAKERPAKSSSSLEEIFALRRIIEKGKFRSVFAIPPESGREDFTGE
jgi:hypothetical protein